jgi:hypothetical protein
MSGGAEIGGKSMTPSGAAMAGIHQMGGST